MARTSRNAERDDELRRAYNDGATCAELMEKFDLSKARVYQIVSPNLYAAQLARKRAKAGAGEAQE